MFDGSVKPVEEIVTGDLLMGPDSKPRRVESTCTGREMLYRVTPKQGDPYVVNESHILSLKMTRGAEYPDGAIVNIGVLDYLAESETFRHCAKGWRVARRDVLVTGITVEPIGDGDYYGFEISGPDRLFLLGDFTVTHNTVLFSYIVDGATKRGNRILILGHRQELTDQIHDALTELELPHGFIAAGYPENREAPVQIASVATLVRRLDLLTDIDLIVVDESHHVVASTYQRILAAAGALPDSEIGGGLGATADRRKIALLGTTATPERLDGKPLDDIFDYLVCGPTHEELIAGGWLVRPVCFAPERLPDLSGVRTRMGDYETGALADRMGKPIVIQSAVDEYQRLCNGAPAIAFCVDIKHSQAVVEAFQAGGFRAAHLDGDTPKDERRRILAALATGEIQVVGNCGIISEGLDVPGVHAAILLRPTKSLTLFVQQTGRAMRPAPDKSRALILDHAGNVFQHGPPDAPRTWSLTGRDKEAERAERELQRRCPECGCIIPLGSWHCEECGAVLREPARDRVEVETHLVPADRLASMTYRQALAWAGRSEARLRLVAQARGYKRGWIWHVLHDLGGAA